MLSRAIKNLSFLYLKKQQEFPLFLYHFYLVLASKAFSQKQGHADQPHQTSQKEENLAIAG